MQRSFFSSKQKVTEKSVLSKKFHEIFSSVFVLFIKKNTIIFIHTKSAYSKIALPLKIL